MRNAPEFKRWEIRGRVTKGVVVEVLARNSEEALSRFEELAWEHEQETETIDWESTGIPRLLSDD